MFFFGCSRFVQVAAEGSVGGVSFLRRGSAGLRARPAEAAYGWCVRIHFGFPILIGTVFSAGFVLHKVLGSYGLSTGR